MLRGAGFSYGSERLQASGLKPRPSGLRLGLKPVEPSRKERLVPPEAVSVSLWLKPVARSL
jgi:hypothetical protein